LPPAFLRRDEQQQQPDREQVEVEKSSNHLETNVELRPTADGQPEHNPATIGVDNRSGCWEILSVAEGARKGQLE
jgi:hypothetical protein